jgi:hypothetical protein
MVDDLGMVGCYGDSDCTAEQGRESFRCRCGPGRVLSRPGGPDTDPDLELKPDLRSLNPTPLFMNQMGIRSQECHCNPELFFAFVRLDSEPEVPDPYGSTSNQRLL